MSTTIETTPILYKSAENFKDQLIELFSSEETTFISENKTIQYYKPMDIGGKIYNITKKTYKNGLIDLPAEDNTLPFKIVDHIYYVIKTTDQTEKTIIVNENKINTTINLLFWINLYKMNLNS